MRSEQDGQDADTKIIDGFENGAKIEFDSVHFKYPTRDVTVFNNLSFTVSVSIYSSCASSSSTKSFFLD